MKIAPVVAGLALTLAAVSATAVSSPAAATEAGNRAVSAALESTITLRAPALTSVVLGRAVTVSGAVTGGVDSRRTVRLELETPRGWMPLTTVQAAADGSYTATVPTHWFYSGRVRASVVATDTHAAASSATTFPMTVKPSFTPRGRAGDHVLSHPDVRWNPCEVIRYKVNSAGAPRDALRQVKKAVALTARATGFKFRYAGSTDAIAWRDDNRGRTWSDVPLTISWGSERQASGLRGNVVGLGGWRSAMGGEILHGGVVLDRSARLRAGFRTGPTWGTLLLHEIGHAMNLNHAQGPEQVMHSGIHERSPGDFQAGDLAGLARTGAMGGCVDGDDSAGGRRVTVVRAQPRP